MSRRNVLLLIAGLVTAAVALSGARLAGWLDGEDDELMTVTADFTDTTGVYVGNDVTYLGVEVGEIVEVQPRGTTMRVVMRLERGTELPRDAGAEILQGSLVTDRFIELGPAYTGGPRLADGAHIDQSHTRAPATIDEVATAIDELVLALDAGLGDDAGGRNLGDLLATTADTLAGNGPHLRRALTESRQALAVINAKDADLAAVTDNLVELVEVLADRDRTIRTFTRTAAETSTVLADQRDELVSMLDSLDDLTRRADRFLRRNGDVLQADLAGVADVVRLVRRHQASLEEAFDVMPTMAENFARAYDWDLGRLRVQFSFAAGPFSAAFRAHACRVFGEALTGNLGKQLCAALFTPQGTGLLDGILDGVFDAVPGGIP
ncbi:MCE family protein [Nocardioides sp. SYSU DS0651]|uniref:MCE family protein n=1 Tax=Nocardioides sp. SYSU DS0651 TaxID=3415955 RepID=UPI003F4CA948